MAVPTRAIPLAVRGTGAESSIAPAHAPDSDASDSNYQAAVSVPLVSRKKQAAVLLSSFVTIALTIGYNQCFGVLQEYYLSPSQDVLVPPPSEQASSPTALIAFVGTLCYGLTWGGGVIVNPIISRIEHGTWTPPTHSDRRWRGRLRHLLRLRSVTVCGVLMVCAGFILASFCRSIWALLLTQGLLVGLGMSMLYFPLLAPAPEYFTNHRATAMGFILAGGGTGGLIFSPILRALLSSVGGRWTLRIWALVNLVVGLPVAWTVPRSPYASMSTENSAERRKTRISRALGLEMTFLFSVAVAFLQAAGAQLPLAFIPSYTVTLGYSASEGANLLAASNVINAVFRVLTGYTGDRLGRQNTIMITLFLAAASVFAFWLSSILSHSLSYSFSLWIAFVVLYSISAGGYYSLFPAIIAEVFGIRQYAAVNAFILFVRGLGTMFGSPVGGQLLKNSAVSSAYASIAYWDGALLMGAAACCIGVRWADARRRGWKWIA